MNLQTSYDLALALETRAPEIERTVQPREAA
jgi:plasmid maintenance system antidote protein VapI